MAGAVEEEDSIAWVFNGSKTFWLFFLFLSALDDVRWMGWADVVD